MTRHIATFYLKSGNSFEVECTELEWAVNQETNSITKYVIHYPKNYQGTRISTVLMDEIEAITTRDVRWWQ